MHINQLAEGKIQTALTSLFNVDYEEGNCFLNMEFEDTRSKTFHLNVVCDFAEKQGFTYLGVHLSNRLLSQTKLALIHGFKVAGKICAICKIEDTYLPCILDSKGIILEPFDTGLDIGTDPLKEKVLYGWYIFKRNKS